MMESSLGSPNFEEMLVKSGLKFQRSGQPMLSEDQVVFQRNLNQNLTKHGNPKIIENFLSGFANFIEDTRKLYFCLSPILSDATSVSVNVGNHDSLVRLLLRDTALQPQLVVMLLEKLAELNTNDDSAFEEGDLKKVPLMILFQFRRLDVLVDSSECGAKLLEIFEVVTLDMQKEIIAVIPEILYEKDHGSVAQHWADLLKQRIDLTVAILDSFPMLVVSSDVISNVKTTVFDMMESVRLNDLPVIVRFLLQGCETTQDAMTVLKELKSKLDFSSSGISTPQRTSQVAAKKADQKKRNYQVLTLLEIRSSMEQNSDIGNALIKLIDSEQAEVEQLSVIDVLLIFLLLDVPVCKKNTIPLINSCIKKRTLRKGSVRTVFTQHAEICLEYFTPIKCLMEELLRSSDVALRNFAQCLYTLAFSHLDNSGVIQDIISSLITHARSGFDSEMGASLDVLLAFVVEQHTKIAPFGIFLKGLLDYLETWNLTLVRKVYMILSHLGSGQSTDEQELNDSVCILIRKQIGNLGSNYQRMGVIGALVFIKVLLKREVESITEDVKLKEACELFKLAERYMEKDFEAKSLLYDEVATAIQQNEIKSIFETWLADYMAGDFENDFVTEANDELQKIPGVEGELMFTLNVATETENNICINLLPIGATDSTTSISLVSSKKRVFLACLSSQFRLLRLCVQSAYSNDLEEIDALLGCPVYFVSKNSLDNFFQASNTQKKFICRCCFTLINWFIELVNAFVSQEDVEIQMKVLDRLKEIVEFRVKLAEFLAVTVDFMPPPAHFDMEPKIAAKLTIPKQKPKVAKKKSTKKGTKRKRTTSPSQPSASKSRSGTQIENEEEVVDDIDEDDMDISPEKEKSLMKAKKADPVDLHMYRIFFREFDIDVFHILSYPVILKRDDEAASKPNLSLEVLMFLLDDLNSKLEASLSLAGDSAKKGFGVKEKSVQNSIIHQNLLMQGSDTVAAVAIELLPHLRKQLDKIASQLHEARHDSDEEDESDKSVDDPEALACAFRSILSIIEKIFNWNGFKSGKNVGLMKQTLKQFCEKPTEGEPKDLTRKSFSYFNNLMKIAPDFSSAVAVVGILNSVAEKNSQGFLNNNLAEVALNILKKSWAASNYGSSKSQALNNPFLAKLLTMYFRVVHDKLDAIEIFVTKAIPELTQEENETDASKTYPTLTRISFPVYYRALYEQLIGNINKSRPRSSQDDLEWLLLWNLSVKIFKILVVLVKTFETPIVFSICLKNSRQFVELFIKYAMPLLDRALTTKNEETITLLKAMQQSTRNLQNICTHSKTLKSVSLTRLVPYLKKALEIFVFRVKAMLEANNCNAAFWVGNLKNRTLQGHEILSQSQTSNKDSDEEEVEENAESEHEEEDDGNNGNISDSY